MSDYPRFADVSDIARWSGCCVARLGRLSDPSSVRDRASATFEDTVALVNPAGLNIVAAIGIGDYLGGGYFYALMDVVDDEPCRTKFPDGCFFGTGGFCHAPTGECRWKADARSNNSTVKTPYWLGRNLCVRGRGHKPLSLWCPEACGCHRGDQDCPLQCPERDATTPICPAHQKSFPSPECQDQLTSEICCPRHPRAHGFDVGFSSVGTNGTARPAAGE